ncbi:MAG: FixH family protein [Planctomycetota bacterium]|nr:FixH family protein [Planctomycetota bacterium]
MALDPIDRSVPAAALVAACVLALGCGDSPRPVDADASGDADAPTHSLPGGESFEALSARGTFAVVLEPEGGDVPLNEPFAMRVHVIDSATGEPLEGADAVTLDARMPIHGHGMLRDVELVEREGGGYRAEGLLLHMVGPWEFHVDVQRGPLLERAQVEYELTL